MANYEKYNDILKVEKSLLDDIEDVYKKLDILLARRIKINSQNYLMLKQSVSELDKMTNYQEEYNALTQKAIRDEKTYKSAIKQRGMLQQTQSNTTTAQYAKNVVGPLGKVARQNWEDVYQFINKYKEIVGSLDPSIAIEIFDKEKSKSEVNSFFKHITERVQANKAYLERQNAKSAKLFDLPVDKNNIENTKNIDEQNSSLKENIDLKEKSTKAIKPKEEKVVDKNTKSIDEQNDALRQNKKLKDQSTEKISQTKVEKNVNSELVERYNLLEKINKSSFKSIWNSEEILKYEKLIADNKIRSSSSSKKELIKVTQPTGDIYDYSEKTLRKQIKLSKEYNKTFETNGTNVADLENMLEAYNRALDKNSNSAEKAGISLEEYYKKIEKSKNIKMASIDENKVDENLGSEIALLNDKKIAKEQEKLLKQKEKEQKNYYDYLKWEAEGYYDFSLDIENKRIDKIVNLTKKQKDQLKSLSKEKLDKEKVRYDNKDIENYYQKVKAKDKEYLVFKKKQIKDEVEALNISRKQKDQLLDVEYSNLRKHIARSKSTMSSSLLSFNALAKAFTGIGFAYLGTGTAREFITTGSDYEGQFELLKALSDESSFALDELNNKTLNLSKNSIALATELGSLNTELRKLGEFDFIDEIGQVSTGLTTIFQSDLKQNAIALKTTANIFDQTGDEIIQTGDQLAQAFRLSPLNIENYFAALEEAGPTAKGFGLNAKQLINILSKLAKANVVGAKAGEGLRNMFVSFGKASSPTAKALGGTADNIEEIYTLLEKAKIAGADFNKAVFETSSGKVILEASQIAPLIALASQADGLREMDFILQHSNGVLNEMAKKTLPSFNNQWKLVQSAWDAQKIAGFESIKGKLNAMVSLLKQGAIHADDLAAFLLPLIGGVGLTSGLGGLLSVTKMGLAGAGLKGFMKPFALWTAGISAAIGITYELYDHYENALKYQKEYIQGLRQENQEQIVVEERIISLTNSYQELFNKRQKGVVKGISATGELIVAMQREGKEVEKLIKLSGIKPYTLDRENILERSIEQGISVDEAKKRASKYINFIQGEIGKEISFDIVAENDKNILAQVKSDSGDFASNLVDAGGAIKEIDSFNLDNQFTTVTNELHKINPEMIKLSDSTEKTVKNVVNMFDAATQIIKLAKDNENYLAGEEIKIDLDQIEKNFKGFKADILLFSGVSLLSDEDLSKEILDYQQYLREALDLSDLEPDSTTIDDLIKKTYGKLKYAREAYTKRSLELTKDSAFSRWLDVDLENAEDAKEQYQGLYDILKKISNLKTAFSAKGKEQELQAPFGNIGTMEPERLVAQLDRLKTKYKDIGTWSNILSPKGTGLDFKYIKMIEDKLLDIGYVYDENLQKQMRILKLKESDIKALNKIFMMNKANDKASKKYAIKSSVAEELKKIKELREIDIELFKRGELKIEYFIDPQFKKKDYKFDPSAVAYMEKLAKKVNDLFGQVDLQFQLKEGKELFNLQKQMNSLLKSSNKDLNEQIRLEKVRYQNEIKQFNLDQKSKKYSNAKELQGIYESIHKINLLNLKLEKESLDISQKYKESKAQIEIQKLRGDISPEIAKEKLAADATKKINDDLAFAIKKQNELNKLSNEYKSLKTDLSKISSDEKLDKKNKEKVKNLKLDIDANEEQKNTNEFSIKEIKNLKTINDLKNKNIQKDKEKDKLLSEMKFFIEYKELDNGQNLSDFTARQELIKMKHSIKMLEIDKDYIKKSDKENHEAQNRRLIADKKYNLDMIKAWQDSYSGKLISSPFIGIEEASKDLFSTMIDDTQTGTEKWLGIWDNFKNGIAKTFDEIINDIVKQGMDKVLKNIAYGMLGLKEPKTLAAPQMEPVDTKKYAASLAVATALTMGSHILIGATAKAALSGPSMMMSILTSGASAVAGALAWGKAMSIASGSSATSAKGGSGSLTGAISGTDTNTFARNEIPIIPGTDKFITQFNLSVSKSFDKSINKLNNDLRNELKKVSDSVNLMDNNNMKKKDVIVNQPSAKDMHDKVREFELASSSRAI